MAETQLAERPKRKSVAFSEDTKIVDSNGEVTTEINGTADKSTAESHSTENGDKEVDEVTELFKGLKKGKKSKKPKDTDGEATEEAITADGEFDPSALKKKKKKKPAKTADVDDFEAKLAEAGVGEEGRTDTTTQEQEGDLEQGTGIWQHNSTQPISYPQLLTRFFTILQDHNPSLLGGTKSYKIPPPQCLREGNKKTIFANIVDICKRINRSEDHLQQFIFAELGTNGSVDGNRRLVIKGRYQQKQIENLIRRYIVDYVTCKTCHSVSTQLSKGENRLYFITCMSCQSRRSVTAIKQGYSAQIGKRKRQQG